MATEEKGSRTRLLSLSYDMETGLAVPTVAVYMVYLTIFMDTLAATISTPALPYYAREFNASNAQIGYLFGAWSFTSTFCAPMLSRLSDSIGRKRILQLSLLGAGVAAITQGLASSYYLLLASRAFSGIWAAVGSSAQVYLADVCSPASLGMYMSHLSSMPGAAMIFGPGLGGGLSKFGLNVPILVDGCLSFVGFILVSIYLPESPVWKQKHQLEEIDKESGRVKEEEEPVDKTVHVLGVAQFLNGISFGTAVSMTTISLNAKFGFDSLQVGYTFVGAALVMLMTSVWIAPVLMANGRLFAVATIGSVLSGTMLVCMALASNMCISLGFFLLSRFGSTLKGATTGSITALYTTVSNRGQVFALAQTYLNMGRLVGPLVAGHLATQDPILAPWVLAGVCNVASAIVLLYARPKKYLDDLNKKRDSIEYSALLASSDFKDLMEGGKCGAKTVLEDEQGDEQDIYELGKYVATLLAQRHYRWISHKDAIYRMLDKLLPELHREAREHVLDVEKLMKHADGIHIQRVHPINERKL